MIACENIRFSSLFAAGDVSRNVRNVPSGEERGEMDVFALGYMYEYSFFRFVIPKRHFWEDPSAV